MLDVTFALIFNELLIQNNKKNQQFARFFFYNFTFNEGIACFFCKMLKLVIEFQSFEDM